MVVKMHFCLAATSSMPTTCLFPPLSCFTVLALNLSFSSVSLKDQIRPPIPFFALAFDLEPPLPTMMSVSICL